MGGVPNAPGPSPTLGSLGPSHQWRHKSRASLRGPPCAHGVVGTPQGEVRDRMEGVPNAPGPSPTLGSLGPSHQWRHKSRASLRGPPCAHGVAGTPQGEVRDNMGAGLAKNGPKCRFKSFPDLNPGLPRSNPVSTPNPDPNPVLTPNLEPNSIPDPNPVLDQLFPDPSLNLDPVPIQNFPNFRIS